MIGRITPILRAAGVLFVMFVVVLHFFRGYLGYFDAPRDFTVETKSGTFVFVHAKSWRKWNHQMVVKDGIGEHVFPEDAIQSVFYPNETKP